MHRFLPLVLLLACAAAHAQAARIDPLAEIAPVAGLDDDDAFGRAVAVEGEWAVVGASRGSCRTGAVGSAFVYRRGVGGWALDAELRLEEPGAACRFGTFVAVRDGRVAVLATGTPTTGTAMVLYDRGPEGWAESGRIDLSVWGPSIRPVSFDPARLLLVVPGIRGCLVFEPVNGTWVRTTTLAVPGWGTNVEVVAAGDRVAMRGSVEEDGVRHPEVAVFERSEAGWARTFLVRYPEGEDVRTLALGDAHLVVVQSTPSFWAVAAQYYIREAGGWVAAGPLALAPEGDRARRVEAATFDGATLVAVVVSARLTAWDGAVLTVDLSAADPSPAFVPLPERARTYDAAIAADAGWAVIGLPEEEENRWLQTGAAFAARYAEEAAALTRLEVPGYPRGSALFGYAVALDGSRMAAVARSQRTQAETRLHVLRSAAGGRTWVEEAAFSLSSSPSCPTPLALDGDRLVAGAETFAWDGAAWARGRRLDSACPTALAIDGGRLAVGNRGLGHVEVYEADGDGWRRTTTLRGAPGSTGFGHAVGLDGGRLVVSSRSRRADGEYGTVDVFEARGTEWVQTGSLMPPAAGVFGAAVGLGGGWAVAGAPIYSGPTSVTEAVRVARGPFGAEVAALASPLPARSLFGASVAVDGDRVLVGAPLADADQAEGVGAAFLFEHDGRGWSEAREVPRPALLAGSRFGSAVAVDGQRLLVGAPYDGRVAQDAGTVFLYASSFATPSDAAPAPAGAELSAPSPHPARSRTRLALTLPGPGSATVTLHDALGRRVGTLLDGLVAGPTEVEIATAGLAAGVYVVRATWEGGAATQRVVVVR